MRTWSVELEPRGIRGYIVHPGVVVTPGYKHELGLSDEQIRELEKQASNPNALGRVGTPDEIAQAVLFLASDESS